jgi:aspartate 1-decarboxylase
MALSSNGFCVSIVLPQYLHLITVAQVALNINGSIKIDINPKIIKKNIVTRREAKVASVSWRPSPSL